MWANAMSSIGVGPAMTMRVVAGLLLLLFMWHHRYLKIARFGIKFVFAIFVLLSGYHIGLLYNT